MSYTNNEYSICLKKICYNETSLTMEERIWQIIYKDNKTPLHTPYITFLLKNLDYFYTIYIMKDPALA